MEENKLNDAFQEIVFSEDFTDRVMDSLENGRQKRNRYRRILAIASCLLILCMTGTYVTARYFGGIESIFGTPDQKYDEYIHKDAGTAEGKFFRMKIKEFVCTRNEIYAMIGVEGLTERAQKMIKENQIKIQDRCTNEMQETASGSASCEGNYNYLDNEKEACYLYTITTIGDYRKSEGKKAVSFVLQSDVEELEVPIVLDHFMNTIEIPLEQEASGGRSLIFHELSITPMTLNLKISYTVNAKTIVTDETMAESIVLVRNGEKVKLKLPDNKEMLELAKNPDYEEKGKLFLGDGSSEENMNAGHSDCSKLWEFHKFLNLEQIDAVIVDGKTYKIKKDS